MENVAVTEDLLPKCRFCFADSGHQSIRSNVVYGDKSLRAKFLECSDCSMVYLYPPMSKSEEAEFYGKEFEKFMDTRAGSDINWNGPEEHIRTNQRELIRRLNWLPLDRIFGSDVLEMGCSSGFLLKELEKRGARTSGVEPSGVFSEYLKKQGMQIYADLKDMDELQRFDFIFHYYVLEHIADLDKWLLALYEKLRPGGEMIFEVPNVADPLLTVYRSDAFEKFYWSYAHHWYFSKKSLSKLLERLNFRFTLYSEQRYDLSNHIVWLRDHRPGGYGAFSSIFSKELDLSYKNCLRSNWLCDTIVAKIQKPEE